MMNVFSKEEAQRLMELIPCTLDKMTNIKGQEVIFYEHPELGDECPVLGVINGVMFETEHWETYDMIHSIDYQPILMEDGTVLSHFEID